MHHVAVIDKDPDSDCGVQFPEVPGCYSATDSFDDVVPNAIEALSLFFEDGEPVPPRGMEGVREQVAESITEGAVLMMIPYVRDRKRVGRVNLILEKGFLDTLDEAGGLLRHDGGVKARAEAQHRRTRGDDAFARDLALWCVAALQPAPSDRRTLARASPKTCALSPGGGIGGEALRLGEPDAEGFAPFPECTLPFRRYTRFSHNHSATVHWMLSSRRIREECAMLEEPGIVARATAVGMCHESRAGCDPRSGPVRTALKPALDAGGHNPLARACQARGTARRQLTAVCFAAAITLPAVAIAKNADWFTCPPGTVCVECNIDDPGTRASFVSQCANPQAGRTCGYGTSCKQVSDVGVFLMFGGGGFDSEFRSSCEASGGPLQ